MTTKQLSLLPSDYSLASLYRRAHDVMRNVDGLQPQEAFDELLKFLFYKQANEELGPKVLSSKIDSLTKEEVHDVAETIRNQFSTYVDMFNSWFKELWKDSHFHLSDNALVAVFHLFQSIDFNKVSFDVRSTALREFLTPELRKGLGIYLTPDDVVKMMVEFVAPRPGQSVYDPACGSGTFLIETLKLLQANRKKNVQNPVWGTDKNPRMLLLAELNLGHYSDVTFQRRLIDSLFPILDDTNHWPDKNTFDIIFTNPPFGVMLENNSFDLREFQTCRTRDGYLVNRQPSEIVFIEKALEYLKPGGTLAIVLPKSIITNSSLDTARKALDKIGYICAAVILPPETFSTTGTQTSTVILFIKKYAKKENFNEQVEIAFSNVTNVGYDSTGRLRPENQLPILAAQLRACVEDHVANDLCRPLSPIAKGETFSRLRHLLAQKTISYETLKLRDVLETITNGRTPPRQSYTEDGLFVVKVGNLTGNGLDWSPRDRNFVSREEREKRKKSKTLMLKKGDILLTAAAHSPVYIAKKVDIVDEVPAWLHEESSFVGEVMLIRVKTDLIDPYALLAFLRMPSTTEHIQMLIRGQTAHLYANDLMDFPVPSSLLKPNKTLSKLMTLLRRETELNSEINRSIFEQQKALARIVL